MNKRFVFWGIFCVITIFSFAQERFSIRGIANE